MEVTVDQAIQMAIQAQNGGNLQEADRIYTQVLRFRPNHPDANHNMGVLAISIGKDDQSIPYFERAVAANPKIEQFWTSLIGTLIRQHRYQEASDQYLRAQNIGYKNVAFEEHLSSLSSTNASLPILHSSEYLAALALKERGAHNDAIEILKSNLPSNRGDVQYICLLAQCFILSNDLDSAEHYINIGANIDHNSLFVGCNTTRLLLAKGNYKKALEVAKHTTNRYPNNPEGLSVFGNCLRVNKLYRQSIDVLDRSISLDPSSAEPYANRGLAYIGLQNIDLATRDLETALNLNPDFKALWIVFAKLQIENADFQAASEFLAEVISKDQENADLYFLSGVCRQQLNELNSAIHFYELAIHYCPEYVEALNNLGLAYKNIGHLQKAIECFTRAVRIKPDFADAYINLANTQKDVGDVRNAIDNYEKSISLSPTSAWAFNNLGAIHKDLGNTNEATECFASALKLDPNNGEIHRNLTLLKKYSSGDSHYSQMADLYNSGHLKGVQLAHLCFALSKSSEDMGNYYDSFQKLNEGNTLCKKLSGYDISVDKQLFDKLRSASNAIDQISFEIHPGATTATPIFILGMPRSGTTLVEQIVSCHSEVHAAGELPYIEVFGKSLSVGSLDPCEKSITQFRQAYLEELTKRSENRRFVTDKMPPNFRFMSLICKALPEAKIFHIERDGAATCWSNYKHFFQGPGLAYTHDLSDLVLYFHLYQDLLALWQSKYGDRFLTVKYEDLTTNQEAETRRFVQYLGLEWQDALLTPHKNTRIVSTASSEQVRKKVYTGSSQAWKKYEQYLDGALSGL